MILASFIPDPLSAAKQSAGSSQKGQADAQAQFDDVLANVPDAQIELQVADLAGDASNRSLAISSMGNSAVQQATGAATSAASSLAATSFFNAVSNTQTSAISVAAVSTTSTLALAKSLTGSLPAVTTSPAITSKSAPPSQDKSVSGPTMAVAVTRAAPLQTATAPVLASVPPASTPGPSSLNAGSTSAIPTIKPSPTFGVADVLAALSTNLNAVSHDGVSKTDLQTGAASHRRSDPKAGIEAVDATVGPSTQGSAVPETPAPPLLSGLLGLLPTPVAQLKTSSSPTVAPSGAAAKASNDVAAANPLTLEVGATPHAAFGAQMPSPTPFAPKAVETESGEAPGSPLASAATSKDAAPALALLPIVTSVTVESQLAPSLNLAPMLQVIDTVQRMVSGEGESASTAAVTVSTPATPVLASRTMTLVLEPDNLGTVTVRMQLRGTNLDLQLDVANPHTLGLLTRDKDGLTAAMSGQDYQIGTLTMRASDTQNASQGSDNGTQHEDQRSSGSSSFQGSGTPQDGRSTQNGDSGSTSSGEPGGDRASRRRQAGDNDEQSLQRDPRSLSANGSAGVYI